MCLTDKIFLQMQATFYEYLMLRASFYEYLMFHEFRRNLYITRAKYFE